MTDYRREATVFAKAYSAEAAKLTDELNRKRAELHSAKAKGEVSADEQRAREQLIAVIQSMAITHAHAARQCGEIAAGKDPFRA